MDWGEINARMRKNRERADAFRRKHEASLPALFEADDRYWAGGPKEVLMREIESACLKRPDLAGEIRTIWRWTEGEEGDSGFIARC